MNQSWKRWSWKLCSAFLAMGGALARVVVLFPIASWDSVLAQITPDTTLGTENSTVTSIGPIDFINGGATRGANLLHSFREFSIDEARGAYFANPSGIENILSRVTGANLSNILGTLGVLGNANLFLMNPNGIIFGPNASLDVNGSFVGTTANAIGFKSGDIFSANPVAPLPTALLNVNPDAFFFNQIAAGAIINRSTMGGTGLVVPEGKSLLLVGGDVRLEGGHLLVPGGRVELAGVRGTSTVGLSVDDSYFGLSFPDSGTRADVSLTNGAHVNVTALRGGSIAINAQNLEIVRGSSLQAGTNSQLGKVGIESGDIEINAAGTINLTNNSSIVNSVLPSAVGNAGDINITTGSLYVMNSAQLAASTEGQGNAGNVTILARDRVSLDGEGRDSKGQPLANGAVSKVEEGAVGKGGDVTVIAGSLSVTNGARLDASTEGQGNAGNVTINARDTVSLEGRGRDASRVISDVGKKAVGNGGEINITTGSLSVTNGAKVAANTYRRGNAGNVTILAREAVSFNRGSVNTRVSEVTKGQGGNITISTGSLSLSNGARLNVETEGQGDAGNVTIHARDRISLDGVGRGGGSTRVINEVQETATGNGGDINITTGSFSITNGAQLTASTRGRGDAGNVKIQVRETLSFDGKGRNGSFSAALSTVSSTAMGDGGAIDIKAGSLFVTNGAQLSASSEGKGAAGNIKVAADSILLDNQAALSSETIGGQGNIFLRSRDLVLRRDSNITTDATGTATGGSIIIDAGVIAALENSDISASAQESSGGQIRINAQGIFRTLGSDITATSQQGSEFSGTVEINTPDIDPSRGLVTLPAQPTDTEVAQTCQPGASQASSKFVITGRGGLPPNPSEALSSDAIQVDWVTLNPGVENRSIPATATNPTAPESAPIVEAQGWVIGSNREVVLTASAPTVTPHSSRQIVAECRVPQSKDSLQLLK